MNEDGTIIVPILDLLSHVTGRKKAGLLSVNHAAQCWICFPAALLDLPSLSQRGCKSRMCPNISHNRKEGGLSLPKVSPLLSKSKTFPFSYP